MEKALVEAVADLLSAIRLELVVFLFRLCHVAILKRVAELLVRADRVDAGVLVNPQLLPLLIGERVLPLAGQLVGVSDR